MMMMMMMLMMMMMMVTMMLTAVSRVSAAQPDPFWLACERGCALFLSDCVIQALLHHEL
jgi:hypothetical protein